MIKGLNILNKDCLDNCKLQEKVMVSQALNKTYQMSSVNNSLDVEQHWRPRVEDVLKPG